ncbi:MAG: hypothetical protein ACREX3_13520 [Gammaproteobacteria bacterium]
MSLEDLESAGILLPREEWGKRDLRTAVNKPLLVLAMIVAVVSCGLMYVGDGGPLTWAGGGVYLVDLLMFTWLSWRAVEGGGGR